LIHLCGGQYGREHLLETMAMDHAHALVTMIKILNKRILYLISEKPDPSSTLIGLITHRFLYSTNRIFYKQWGLTNP
jgi:hypothetical protein